MATNPLFEESWKTTGFVLVQLKIRVLGAYIVVSSDTLSDARERRCDDEERCEPDEWSGVAYPLLDACSMKTDAVRGKTFRWTFTDGPMAKRTFEHSFELAQVSATVCALSYMSGGYTLTVILDFGTNNLFAFSSNEKAMTLQHGTFEEITAVDTTEVFHKERKDPHAVAGSMTGEKRS